MKKKQEALETKTGKIESLNTPKEKKEKKTTAKKLPAKTIQQLIPYLSCFPDGIIQLEEKKYSKMYAFEDANYIAETEDRQADMLLTYQKLLNSLPVNVSIQFVIINSKLSQKQIAESYFIADKGDELDKLRKDYNAIITEKIREGRNDIRKKKYFILTLESTDYVTASKTFNTLEVGLTDTMKGINKDGFRALSLWERLEIMYYISNRKEENKSILFESLYGKYRDAEGFLNPKMMKKQGVTTKNMIAPEIIKKNMKTNSIQLGEYRYCRSFQLIDMPQSLDASFLTRITDIPCEMVTTIDFTAIKKQSANRMVKMQNTSVKADVIKISKTAVREGCSPELYMNEDLAQAQEEAKKLRNDVVQGGKKLFQVTFLTTIFADSEDDLKELINQYNMKCADESLKPNTLLGQQERAYKSCLCTGRKFVVLDRLLTSDSVIAINPFHIQEIMDEGGHFYGINSISKNMVMCNRRNTKAVANGLVFGMSGSGKSFLTKGEIIPNALDTDDKIIILDPENEYWKIAKRFGGNVIDLQTKTNYYINPCDMDMEWDEPEADPMTEKCDFMVGLVESILGKGRECNAFEVNVIHRATNRMYANYLDEMQKRHEEDKNCASIDITISPTLEDFYNELIADGTAEGNKVAMSVEPYCIGNYNIFAHRTNIDTSNNFLVYNLLHLPEKMKEMAMKVCLSSIWTEVVKNRVNNEKYGTKRNVWVYLDEFHLFFQTESAATTIKAYFKRVRKYNGIMTGITQDVADLVSTPQGAGMFSNTGFFIILNQLPAGQMAVKRSLNISDTLIDYINEKPSGVGLLRNNNIIVPINYRISADTELYKLMSTNQNDKKTEQTSEREKTENDEVGTYEFVNGSID